MEHAHLTKATQAVAATPSRRQCLARLGGALAGGLLATALPVARAAQELPLGWVKPRPATPDWSLTGADGGTLSLAKLVSASGGPTAVQLMFTGCTTSCPAQGLLFATMAARTRARPATWLSISIDVLSDDAARLRAWQRRFGERPAPSWHVAVAAMRDVDAIAAFLRGLPARADTHTNQVFVFDRQGRLAYRTGDDPGPEFLEPLLQAVA